MQFFNNRSYNLFVKIIRILFENLYRTAIENQTTLWKSTPSMANNSLNLFEFHSIQFSNLV